jgi:hypothetical protein
MHIDELEGYHPGEYRTLDITPSAGLLRESREPPDMAAKRKAAFSTGALVSCEDQPSAEYRDGTYLARCDEDHLWYGIAHTVDIVVDQGRTNTVVWSRSFDAGWRIAGFGWNPKSPLLAVLVQSSVPQENPIAWILGFFGHPPPDETVHLIVVSAATKRQRDYIVVEHAVYGNPRLLRWENSAR